MEEVKDSAKAWLSERLKNPYFGSVMAIWLITNRVLLFSLFNFQDNQSLIERVSWVHHQLQNKVVLNWFGMEGVKGFYTVIIYSFILGFIAMIAFNYLNVFGKWGYNFFGKWANTLKREIEPLKWVHIDTLNAVIAENNKLNQENDKQATNIIKLKQEHEVAVGNVSGLKSEVETLKQEIRTLKKEPVVDYQIQKNLINYLNDEHNKTINHIEDYQITNQLDHDFELTTFLNSEDSHDFDRVVMGINRNNLASGVPSDVIDLFLKRKFIALNNGQYEVTPKGKLFYMEYYKKHAE
ncbi:MAG: hypothetical protein K0Q95_2099 [Bacteroidota bacterium]|jgi:hypothetical protein|nr:hypothetical protein [Bacteroidota bacterium]